MRNWHRWIASRGCLPLLLLAGLLLTGCRQPAALAADAPEEAPRETLTATAGPRTRAAEAPAARYAAYARGHDGFFMPDRPCTRAEMAQMLSGLGLEAPSERRFADVADGSWYAPAVARLSGALHGSGGLFYPDRQITLAELTAILCRVLETPLPEAEGDWYAPAMAAAEAEGWLEGLEETAPETVVRRAMAVTVCNRAAGRTPDRAAIDRIDQTVFLDVSPRDAAYYDILEAALPHDADWSEDSVELPALTPGLHRYADLAYYVRDDGTLCTTPGLLTVDGERYLVEDATGRIAADGAIHMVDGRPVFCTATGALLRGGSWHGFRFDEQGRYTSGDADVDQAVEDILSEVTTDKMTDLQKLRACFDHVRAYRYLGRNASIPDKTMPQANALRYARKIFETGKGDCYNFTAAFYFLARRLGYDATAVVGRCAYRWGTVSHGWVEIPMDGEIRLFDPQIENYNLRSGLSNEAHGAFCVRYADAPGTYYPN